MRALGGIAAIVMLAACGLLPPAPIAVDCGPLADEPTACDSAVEFALDSTSLASGEVAAVVIESAPPACGPDEVGHRCLQPDVIASVFERTADVAPIEVFLIRDEAGWINAAQLR
jgi:hypothetical protein